MAMRRSSFTTRLLEALRWKVMILGSWGRLAGGGSPAHSFHSPFIILHVMTDDSCRAAVCQVWPLLCPACRALTIRGA